MGDLLATHPRVALEDPVPDDEIPDSELTPEMVVHRAVTRYPLMDSSPKITKPTQPGTLRGVFTQAAQRNFKIQLELKDPRIVARLAQPFGKDNLKQSFVSRAALRHVLLPLWKSGFLVGCT